MKGKTPMPFPSGDGSVQPVPPGGARPRVIVPQPSRAAVRQAPKPLRPSPMKRRGK